MDVKVENKADLLRKLPSVNELLLHPDVRALAAEEGPASVTDAVRKVLARVREEIAGGHLDAAGIELALQNAPTAVQRQLRQDLSLSLKSVINGTGVILHTNLGRAPVAAAAVAHVQQIAAGYSNLEFDLATGERGKRDIHVDRLFRKLLDEIWNGAKQSVSTIVVNNNAAAVLLALNTLAEGSEVIVSRGELVEIGGSFRIPEVMVKSGAILREVGTTNRTRLSDYENAISEKTRLLLRVHRSNFEITGFAQRPALPELAELGGKHNLPLLEDLGSGAFFDLQSVGVSNEPGVFESLRSGVSVVTYSGDKLLGGPQAGMISGTSVLVSRMRSNSLFRALRADKLTYAALEATLLAYTKRDYEAIPALRMMRLSKPEIAARAQAIANDSQSPHISLEIIDGASVIGGGAAPSAVLPTSLLAISSSKSSPDQMASRLRQFDPPIVARIEDGLLLIDLRTVFPEQDKLVNAALNTL
jgi:L-seryl-tRNA(Ser) seleniumtransferase